MIGRATRWIGDVIGIAVFWVLEKRVRLAVAVVLVIVAATVGNAWRTLDDIREGPTLISFSSAGISLDGSEKNVLEGNLLPSTVMSLSGDSTSLVYGKCSGTCPPTCEGCAKNISAVSLRARDSSIPLGLANLMWVSKQCGNTKLLIGGSPSLEAMLVPGTLAGCDVGMQLDLGGTEPVLSFNDADGKNQTPKLDPGAVVTWHTNKPVVLQLASTSGPFLPQDAVAKLKQVVGTLTGPVPRLGGAGARTVCTADSGDKIVLATDEWKILGLALANSIVTVQLASRGDGLKRCSNPTTAFATLADASDLALCTNGEDACGFDWAGLSSRTGELSPYSLVVLLLSILSFEPARKALLRRAKKAGTSGALRPPAKTPTPGAPTGTP